MLRSVEGLLPVRVPRSIAAVTTSDNAAALDANTDVHPRALEHIAAVARRAVERPGKREPMALGQTARQPDVLPRAIELPLDNSLLGQRRESLDSLSRNLGAHQSGTRSRTPGLSLSGGGGATDQQ